MRALHTVHEVHDAPGVVPGKDDGKGRKRLRADDAVRLEIVEQAHAVRAAVLLRKMKFLKFMKNLLRQKTSSLSLNFLQIKIFRFL